MSSSTPNIGLTLPIGTEKVSRQIINDNMTKIDTAFGGITNGTMRPVPFAVAVADWSLVAGQYVAEFTTAYVTSTSNEFATFDTGSMKLYCKDIIDIAKKSGGGGMILTTETIPTGTISGMLYVWDTDDGKIPVIIEGTTVPIANGGTGASNLAGAKTNLGIEQCEQDIATLNSHIANDGVLLATFTTTLQEKTLSESLSHFRFALLVAYFTTGDSFFVVASTLVPVSLLTNGTRLIACLNDGTVRKAEIVKDSDTQCTSSGSNGFQNITSAYLYGVQKTMS